MKKKVLMSLTVTLEVKTCCVSLLMRERMNYGREKKGANKLLFVEVYITLATRGIWEMSTSRNCLEILDSTI